MTTNLLPCPFCGNEDIQDWGESTWSRPVKWMYCTECQAHGPHVMLGRGEPEEHWHHRIREEWSHRADLNPSPEVVKELVEVAVADGFYSAAPGEWLVSDIKRVNDAIIAAILAKLEGGE